MLLDALFARLPGVRARLILLTALLCLLMALLALGGMLLLAQANESLRTVYDDRVVPLRQLKTVADMYAVNLVDTTHKVRLGAMDWAAGTRLVEDAGSTVQKQWSAYTQTYLVPQERRLVDELQPLMSRAEALRQRLLALLAARDSAGLERLAREELYPTLDPLGDKLNA